MLFIWRNLVIRNLVRVPVFNVSLVFFEADNEATPKINTAETRFVFRQTVRPGLERSTKKEKQRRGGIPISSLEI